MVPQWGLIRILPRGAFGCIVLEGVARPYRYPLRYPRDFWLG